MRSRIVLLIYFIAVVPAYGQSVPVVSEEIVVTASALSEAVETVPAAVTVITRREIDEREARDVSDVLREVPGLVVSRTGSPGKITSIFTRGSSSKQTLVLWNGVEMNNAYFSAYNFGQMSTAGVERVEIIRGPFSALHGADAVGGVINVISPQTRSGLVVDAESGERGLLSGVLSGSAVGERFASHAAIELRRDDGFAPNDDFESNTLVGGLTFTPRTTVSLGIQGRYSDYDLGSPRNVNADFTAFAPTPRHREDGREWQIAVPIRFDAGRIRYELHAAESRRDDDFIDPDAPFGGAFSDTESEIRTFRGSAQTVTSLGTITIGGEIEDSSAEHTDNFGLDVDRRDRSSRSLFAEDRLSLQTARSGSIELALGVRYDEYETFGSEISPRLAAAWIRGTRKWRAAYGEGFRAPAIGELYIPFFGNPDLGAETSRSFEVGLDQFFRGGRVSLTLFDSDYDNLIAFDAAESRFGNVDSASARGVEIGAERRSERWIAGASYTWLDTEDESLNVPLLRRPRHSGSLSLGYEPDPMGIHLVVAHTGERDDVTDLLPFGRVVNEANTVADLTLRYRVGAVTPYLKIENLWDEQYEEVFGYPSGGRRAIIGVRYSAAGR
jgi:vitamin B12 transporter